MIFYGLIVMVLGLIGVANADPQGWFNRALLGVMIYIGVRIVDEGITVKTHYAVRQGVAGPPPRKGQR